MRSETGQLIGYCPNCLTEVSAEFPYIQKPVKKGGNLDHAQGLQGAALYYVGDCGACGAPLEARVGGKKHLKFEGFTITLPL